jgi:hypothetical protein
MKNLKLLFIVLIVFVLSRLPDLGHDIFNTDVWKWKQRSYDFGSGVFTGNFDKTIQKYHPGVTLMWVGTIGIKIYNLYYNVQFGTDPIDNSIQTVFGLHFVQKFLLVILIGLVVTSIFYLLKKNFGTKTALFLTAFFTLEPFYIALTRVFHLEGLMSSFMLLSTLLLYDFVQNDKLKSLVLSGMVAGLALLTKTSSLYLLPFAGLGLLFSEKRSISYISKNLVFWIIPAILTFIFFWPIMWTKPFFALSELYRGVSEIGVENEHEQFYFGKFVSDPGFTFYPVVLALRSSPLLVIGLLGILFVYRKLEKDKQRFIFYIFLYGLFYLIQSSIPSKKLDRYLLPTVISWALIAGIFFEHILEKIKVKNIIKYCCLSTYFILQIIYLHPEYLSYYNPIFGGLSVGINILEPKWMIGIKQINEYFKIVQKKENLLDAPADQSYEELINTRMVDRVLAVSFPEKYFTQIWPFFRENKSWAVINDLGPLAKYSGFFVYPVWDDKSANEDRFEIEKYGQIKLRGVTLYNVYRKKH